MDGDGSIQVNHHNKKLLQYRLVIKLKNTINNHLMLTTISKHIGGYVRIAKSKNKDEVLWIENNKKYIIKIIEIFKKYPPLTFRLTYQLKFLNDCLLHNNITTYLNTRNQKYDAINYTKPNELYFLKISYFREWLSGFIEAEGCFSIRKIGTFSFSIGQNKEDTILIAIKNYFEIQTEVKLRRSTENFYVLETYNKKSLLLICTHIKNYPLLGEKSISFNILRNKII